MSWTLQLLPSHRSATVNGAGVKISPTAVHAEGDEHETPLKKSPCPCVPGGAGVDWTVHVVPSHRSASSAEAVLPTAVHALGEVQETAPRKSPGLAEVGVDWMLQVVPSHRSVIVGPAGLPELSKAAPTAVQANCDVHETPVSEPERKSGVGRARLRGMLGVDGHVEGARQCGVRIDIGGRAELLSQRSASRLAVVANTVVNPAGYPLKMPSPDSGHGSHRQ